MGLYPTTTAAYPPIKTEADRDNAELSAIQRFLLRQGVLAHVIKKDDSWEITVIRCLDSACSSVELKVLRLMRQSDPERSDQGRIVVAVEKSSEQ